MTDAEYQFLVRNPRTLALVGEIRPQDVMSARWSRLQHRSGSWAIELPRACETLRRTPPEALIPRQALVEIRRNGLREFTGCILARRLDGTQTTWTIEGYDLLDWLRRRVVGATTAQEESGAAETVLKAYVDAELGSGAAWPAADELNVPWTIEEDLERGDTVEYRGQRRSLEDVTADVCRQGNLLQDVILTGDEDAPSGFEYRVFAPTDATEGSGGGTRFTVNLDNVETLGWREDVRTLANTLIVAGDGIGDARTVRTVGDAASQLADFVRVGVYDRREASADDVLDALGAAEIARQLSAAVAADVVPLSTSPHARYREDWDVGWDVTVGVPVAGIDSIDRRVASASVSLTRDAGERISMQLGVEDPRSNARRLEEWARRVNGSLHV